VHILHAFFLQLAIHYVNEIGQKIEQNEGGILCHEWLKSILNHASFLQTYRAFFLHTVDARGLGQKSVEIINKSPAFILKYF